MRGLLQRNKAVAAALAADPELYERMTALLSTGRADAVRAQRIAVDAAGVISVFPMPLAPHEMDVPTLRLPAPGSRPPMSRGPT